MNLLPMIFAFMVIFGVLALTFIRETKSFHILESSFEGQHRTERRVNNTIVSKAYRKIKSEGTIPSQKQPSLPTKKGVFESRRQFFPPFENSKFNLAKLFESDEDLRRHPLYEPMATLLRLLYEKPLFSKLSRPGIEYQILDALLNKAKTLKSQGADPVPGQAKITEDLSELGPDDPALRPIYYKLLKGTNQYSEKGGYPPLGDYFCIDKGKLPISLSFASPQLLEALFGKEIKAFILDKEEMEWAKEHKYVYFSKEDLQTLLNQYPVKAQGFTLIEPFIDTSKQFAPRSECGGKDQITGLTVRKKLHSH